MSFWNRLSIKKQFLSLGLLFLLIIALLLISVNVYMVWQTDNNHRDYTASTLDKMNTRLSVYADYLNRTMISLAYDPVVQDYLISETPLDWFENRQLLVRRLSQSIDTIDGVRTIVVVSISGKATMAGKEISFLDLENLIKPEGSTVLFEGIHNFLGFSWSGYVSMERFPSHLVSLNSFSIHPGSRINTQIGTIYLLLDGQSMDRFLGISQEDDQTRYYLVDQKNQTIYSNASPSGSAFTAFDRDLLTSDQVQLLTIDDQRYYAYQTYNEQIRMHLISLTPVGVIFNNIQRVAFLQAAVLTVLMILVAIILIFFNKSAVRPLLQMSHYFRDITKRGGKREQDLVLNQNLEVTKLADTFNQMLDTIDNLNAQLLDAELYNKKTEIAMLRNQINPHFLYNTLETIKGMSYKEGCEEVAYMIHALGRIFRYSVKSPEKVLLSQEVAMLNEYLSIQKVRFMNRFSVDIQIEDDVLSAEIPKMLLQPIVENAIQHGLELKKEGGILKIGAKETDGHLEIIVFDNGSGFDRQTLSDMFSEMKSQAKNNDSEDTVKIGIANVHGRIRHEYGSPYGLDIKNEEGVGVSVILELPLRFKEYV